jgi:hypothetical protein
MDSPAQFARAASSSRSSGLRRSKLDHSKLRLTRVGQGRKWEYIISNDGSELSQSPREVKTELSDTEKQNKKHVNVAN